MSGRCTAIVPTVGRSALLQECLAALRRDGGPELRILVVAQGPETPGLPPELGVELVALPEPVGFARAANLGLERVTTPYAALVNDDAVVRPPWLAPLLDRLERAPEVAAAQGVNLDAGGLTIDGCGLAWNRRWQAVQILHGRPASRAPRRDLTVFGASATACVYRMSALHAVATPSGIFDHALGSYYEDVDLACRLRAGGSVARVTPRSVALHGGSASSPAAARLALVHRNRYLVLARLLGRGFWLRLPLLALRDLASALAAVARGDHAGAGALVRGLAGAAARLPRFLRAGAPSHRAITARHSGLELELAPTGAAEPLGEPAGEERRLDGLVVHWRSPDALDRLLRAWPTDSRYGLVVIDNSGELELAPRSSLELVRPGENLGFAGGVNRAAAAARAPYLLLLNPDARPLEGAVEALADALDAHPDWGGAAPRLVGEDGAPQYDWQLRPLPRPAGLLRQVFFLRGVPHAASEPPAGATVAQPAAAALCLRRSILAGVGGLDPAFFPAWFEDVDLAARLAVAGSTLHYWPHATFVHGLGGSLDTLGYGPFLWIYYRNLVRYLRKHHGRAWALAALISLPAAALLRALLLPFRRPRRARGRADALRGLLSLALGAVTGFRAPDKLRRAFAAPSS